MSTLISLPEMVETSMNYSAERQKVLALNIASIDTPGYEAQDLVPLDFKNVLASKTRQVPMAVTSPLHMTGGGTMMDMFRSAASRLSFERTPTGSTVVVEEQMEKVAQNATNYQTSTNLYKKIGNLFRETLGLSTS